MSDPMVVLRDALAARYEMQRPLGEGAHGTVLLARDLRHGRHVAIKTLNAGAHSEKAELRFMREIKLLASLQHPNILPLFDSGYVGTVAYYVMPFVDGDTLAKRLQRRHRLEIADAVAVACEILSALACAHAAGVVHRDIKPENILLSADRPLLADFGIALSLRTPPGREITRSGDGQPGTPAYMSPEQLLGDGAIDGRTDLYALGCVLYEMLLGKAPFGGKDGFARRLTAPPPFLVHERPEIPVALERVVRRSLERVPRDRFATAQDMEHALRAAMTHSAHESEGGSAARDREVRRPRQRASLTPTRISALPQGISSFYGRDAELAELTALLSDCRLVTILGPGGVGKTHLAEHFARENGTTYSGGVFITRLGGVTSPELLWSAVGESVGVGHADARDAQSRLVRAIGKKHVLLILDGFEHLARAATSVQSFLEQTPKARVLVTSRERLNVSAEAVLDLEGLTVPARDERADPTKHSSIQLFLHRARLVAPRFALTPDTERSVSRICQLVGGLPLALEMAASMLRSLDSAALAAELERNVDILQSTLRDAPLRHRTLRAVFEQSWASLDSEQREALGRLSIFAAGFSRGAARVVTGVSVHTLAALVDKSLLRYTGSDRYQLHEAIRQHARQRLPTASRDEVANAHAEYYGTFVQARAVALKGKQQEGVAKETIREIAEVRAGWQHALSTDQDALLEKYVDGLYMLYQIRGWFREGAVAFRPVLTGELNTLTKARVLARYGMFLLRIGELTPSREAALRSLRVFRKLHARSDMPVVLRALAEYATVKGRYAVAARLLRHSARLCTESGDRRELASTLLHMGTALLPSGQYMEAETVLRQSVALFESLGDDSTLSIAMTSLGAFLVNHGQADEAEEVLKRALVASRSFGNTRITAAALLNLGQLSMARGDLSLASALSREALDGFQAAGIEEGFVAASRVLGDIYLSMEQEDDALRHYRSALQSAARIGSTRWTMAPLAGIAEVFVRRGDIGRATDLLAVILSEQATEAHDRAKADALARRLEMTLTPAADGSRPPFSLEETLHYLDATLPQ